jgi:hypothetical protein
MQTQTINNMITVDTTMSTTACETPYAVSYTYSSEPEAVHGVFGDKLK